MKRNKYFCDGILICLLAIVSFNTPAQDSAYLACSEQQLLAYYSEILESNPAEKGTKANHFFDEFLAVVERDSSFTFPFEKLTRIGKVYSPDKRLRIYTWNIAINMDENNYYGIIQYYSNRKKSYTFIKLCDTKKINQRITTEEWPGALYYQITETKYSGQKYYALLGLDLNNLLSNKKVIDVVTMNENDELSFCPKLIEYKGKRLDRLVFEYNEKAIMTLRYDDKKRMIVFDHLSPQKPSLEGKFQFYGPDFTYDGLKFEDGIWKYYSNIDITN